MMKVEAVVVRDRVETVMEAVEEHTGHVGVTVGRGFYRWDRRTLQPWLQRYEKTLTALLRLMRETIDGGGKPGRSRRPSRRRIA